LKQSNAEMEVVKEEELVEWKLFATFAEDFAHKE